MSISDRFNELQRKIEKLVKRMEKELIKGEKDALDAIRTILAAAYEKYEVSGILKYEELTRYGRLDKLYKLLKEPINEVSSSNKLLILRILRQAYRDSFEDTRIIMQTATGRTIRGIIKPEVIDAVIQNPISGLTLNERLERSRTDILIKLRETITQGLIKGETYGTMAARAKTVLENDAAKTIRVMRTESHRVMEKSKLDSLQNASNQGVKMMKKWVSSRDSRVRDSHQHMDGKMVPFDKDFYNPKTGGRGPGPGQMGKPEDDINCRCIFTIEIV